MFDGKVKEERSRVYGGDEEVEESVEKRMIENEITGR